MMDDLDPWTLYLQRNTKYEAELQMNLMNGFFIIFDMGSFGQII